MNTSVTARGFTSTFREISKRALGRLESYAAFRADRFRTWKHVRGRRPHLKMFWDDELVSLLSRFHFDGVNIGSFRFLGAPNEGDFRDVGGERYLHFALWGRHLMYVKEGTSDIFFCDYQDWMFQAAEIQSKPLLSLLLLSAEFEYELTVKNVPKYDEIADAFRARALKVLPHHPYVDQMFPQSRTKS